MVRYGAGRVHDVDLAVCLCPGGNAAFLAISSSRQMTPVGLVNG
jgi:hypothetical protein